MQVSKRVPFEDPSVLLGVRGIYIASNVFIAAIYLYIYSQVNKKKGSPLPRCTVPSSLADPACQT